MEKNWKDAIGTMGVCLIIFGAVLMTLHQVFEAVFQVQLLDHFDKDYHWRAIGNDYAGIGAVAIGALMMTCAAVMSRNSEHAAADKPKPKPKA